MNCKKCDNTGIVEVFSDDWPTNCSCNIGAQKDITRLEKENLKLQQKIEVNIVKINALGLVT